MTEARLDKHDRHFRQQLSAMLDGELAPDEAKFMLRRLEHDGELASCWERWQVCGDILRGRHDALLPTDFSERVRLALRGDDVAAMPAPSQASPKAGVRGRWSRWAGAALAASVAMAALLVFRQPASDGLDVSTSSEVATTAPASAPAQPAPERPGAPALPDTAVATLATAAAVAEVPRRAAERRASRGQSQRAALRLRTGDDRGARTMLASANGAGATNAIAVAPIAAAPSLANDPFGAHTIAPSRPWPRAILPGYAGEGAFTASYGNGASGNPAAGNAFRPFEPQLVPQPQRAASEPQNASAPTGPR